MLLYLIRRLWMMIPTLIGITLITFMIIHLAPGDPVSAELTGLRGAVTPEVIEQQRRLYFLDLPLFFNPKVEDVRDDVAKEVAKLAGNRAKVFQGRLRRRGTVIVPHLWPRRAEAAVKAILEGICEDHARICPGGDLQALRAASLWPKLSLEYGSAAVPLAAEAIEGEDRAQQELAAQLLSQVASRDVRFKEGASKEERAEVVEHWTEWWFQSKRDYYQYEGFDRVLGFFTQTQYSKWLARILTLSFGDSMRDGRPVTAKIREAFPVTALLALTALLLAYLIAIPLGVYSAAKQDSLGDRIVTVVLFLLYSLPSFWVALMLILLFGGVGFWDLFPFYGLESRGASELSFWPWLFDRIHHMVLPVICLSYASLAVISRYQRSGLLDVIRQDYIRTARAKGLSERTVIFKHALRNSLIPVITLLGVQIPFLLGGSIILERIFTIPGMGNMAFEAIWFRDYPVIMGVTSVAAGLTMVSLLISDVLYAVVDPRISLEDVA